MNNKQRVLFVVLAIVGVLLTLQINGALAIPEPKEETKKVMKCGYPPFIVGVFEIPDGSGRGGLFSLPMPTIITVLETKTISTVDEQGATISKEVYRFSASYDKPLLLFWCPIHQMFEGPVPYEIYSRDMPQVALDNFLLPANKGKCTEK